MRPGNGARTDAGHPTGFAVTFQPQSGCRTANNQVTPWWMAIQKKRPPGRHIGKVGLRYSHLAGEEESHLTRMGAGLTDDNCQVGRARTATLRRARTKRPLTEGEETQRKTTLLVDLQTPTTN